MSFAVEFKTVFLKDCLGSPKRPRSWLFSGSEIWPNPRLSFLNNSYVPVIALGTLECSVETPLWPSDLLRLHWRVLEWTHCSELFTFIIHLSPKLPAFLFASLCCLSASLSSLPLSVTLHDNINTPNLFFSCLSSTNFLRLNVNVFCGVSSVCVCVCV